MLTMCVQFIHGCLILNLILLTCIKCTPKLSYIFLNTLPLRTNEIDTENNSIEYITDTDNNSTENDNISNNVLRTVLVINNTYGYDFNVSICKKLKNRILCGYNKNIGHIKDDDEIVELSNGCRYRGDRLECGYVIGPFNSSRRPPANDENYIEIETIKANEVQRSKKNTSTVKTYLVKDKNDKDVDIIKMTNVQKRNTSTSKTTLSVLEHETSVNEKELTRMFGTKHVETTTPKKLNLGLLKNALSIFFNISTFNFNNSEIMINRSDANEHKKHQDDTTTSSTPFNLNLKNNNLKNVLNDYSINDDHSKIMKLKQFARQSKKIQDDDTPSLKLSSLKNPFTNVLKAPSIKKDRSDIIKLRKILRRRKKLKSTTTPVTTSNLNSLRNYVSNVFKVPTNEDYFNKLYLKRNRRRRNNRKYSTTEATTLNLGLPKNYLANISNFSSIEKNDSEIMKFKGIARRHSNNEEDTTKHVTTSNSDLLSNTITNISSNFTTEDNYSKIIKLKRIARQYKKEQVVSFTTTKPSPKINLILLKKYLSGLDNVDSEENDSKTMKSETISRRHTQKQDKTIIRHTKSNSVGKNIYNTIEDDYSEFMTLRKVAGTHFNKHDITTQDSNLNFLLEKSLTSKPILSSNEVDHPKVMRKMEDLPSKANIALTSISGSSKEKVRRECVEKDDRIVCYLIKPL